MSSTGVVAYGGIAIQITINNADYTSSAEAYNNSQATSQNLSTSTKYILDVTDTTNIKFRLNGGSDGNVTYGGNTASNLTSVSVIRLGDT